MKVATKLTYYLAFIALCGATNIIYAATFTVTSTATDGTVGGLANRISSMTASTGNIILFGINVPVNYNAGAMPAITRGNNIIDGNGQTSLVITTTAPQLFNMTGSSVPGVLTLTDMLIGAPILQANLAVSLNSTIAFNQTAAGDYSYTNTISGAGNVTYTGGAGVNYTITGNNGYTGITTLTSGTTVIAGNAGAFGTNNSTTALTLSGGTLQSNGALTIARPFTQSASSTLSGSNDFTLSGNGNLNGFALNVSNNTGVITLGGIISGAAAGSSLTVNGGSTLALNGINTFVGGVTVSNNSTVIANNNSSLGAVGSGLILNGGVLQSSVDAVTMANAFTVGNLGGTLSGSNTFTLSGSGTLNGSLGHTNSSTTTLSGLITGTGSITQSAGTLILTNAGNNYQGATTVNNGATLTVNNNSAIGSGSLIFGGGTLDQTIGGTISLNNNVIVNSPGGIVGGNNNITLNGGIILSGNLNNNNTATTTLSGTITGNGTITQSAGTLVLSGNNSYNGVTTLNGGTLNVNHNNALGTGTLSLNGGTLSQNIGGTITLGNAITVGNSNGTLSGTNNLTLNGNIVLNGNLNVSNTAQTNLGGIISGNGNITQTSGTLRLSNANTQVGSIAISNATLELGNTTALGNSANTLTLNNATLKTLSNLTIANNYNLTGPSILGGTNNFTLNGTGNLNGVGLTINAANVAIQLGGSISGVGAGSTLTINALGSTVTLSAVNSYSGATTITNGTLLLTNNNIPSSSGVIINGGSFGFTGSNNFTFSGPLITGAGGLSMQGTGTVTLSTANPGFTGATTVNSGALLITNNNILANSSGITVNAGASFGFGGNNTFNFVTAIDGAGGLTMQGTGTVTLTNTQNYLGATIVNNGTLGINADNRLPTTGALVINGGSFALNNNNQTIASLSGTGGTLALGSGAITIGSAVGSSNFSGNITGTGNVIKQNANTLTLAPTNAGAINHSGNVTVNGGTLVFAPTIAGAITYTGGTSINGGTLQANSVNALSPFGTITIGGAGTLALNNNNQTIGDLTGSGTINLGSAILSLGTNATNTFFTGSITGSGGIIKQNSGALTLSPGVANAISHTGGLTVSGGRLIFAPTAANGINYSGSTNLTAGGILEFSAAAVANGISINGPININGGSLVVNQANALPANTALNIITGNTFSLNGFDQIIGDLSGNGTVSIGAQTLTLGTASNSVFSGSINGTGNIVKQNAGTLALTGVNNYTGTTTVIGGALQVNANSIASDINTILNTSVIFDQVGTGTYVSRITGGGAIVKQNTGNLILTGVHTNTGGTIINAGRLSVNGSISGPVAVNTNATLGGIGTINGNVNVNGGNISPGNSIGTLTINGNLNLSANSVTTIEIAPNGNSSLINVNGNAALNGSFLVLPQAGSYSSSTYTVLKANNISGQFNNVLPKAMGPFQLSLVQPDPQTLNLTLQRTVLVFNYANSDSNEYAVGDYIDSLPLPKMGTDFSDNVIGPLGNITSLTTLNDALESISVGRLAANTLVAQDINFLVNSINTTRLSSLRNHNDEMGPSLLIPSTPKKFSSLPTVLNRSIGKKALLEKQRKFTTHAGLLNDAQSQVQPLIHYGNSRSNIWMYSFGHFAHPKAYDVDPGYETKTGGAVFGMDYQAFQHVVIGAGLGYSGTQLKFDKNAGENSMDNYFGTLYAGWTFKKWFIDASLLSGTTKYQTRQRVVFLKTDRILNGQHQGIIVTPHLGLGYEHEFLNTFFTPFLNVDYSSVRERGYITNGGLSLDQFVENRSSALLRSEIGIKISGNYKVLSKIVSGDWMPNFTLSFINKKAIKKGPTVAGFVGQPGNYQVTYFTRGRNFVSPGVGLIYHFNSDIHMGARIDSEIGSRYKSYELGLRLGISF